MSFRDDAAAADERLDEGRVRELIQWHIASGIHGTRSPAARVDEAKREQRTVRRA